MNKKNKYLLFLLLFFMSFGFIEVVNADEIKIPTFSGISNVSSNEIKLNFKSNSTCSNCGIEILNETTGNYYRVSNTATSYNVKGLIKGQKYRFRINTYYIKNGIYYNSSWTSYKDVTVTEPVVVPTTVNTPSFNSLSRADYNKMKLTYVTSGLTTGVQIYNVTTGKKINTTNKTNYTWTGLSYGKTYKFKIRSYYTSSGKTIYSSWTGTISRTAKLPTPTLSSLKISDYNNIVLSYSTSGTVRGVQVYNVTTGNSSKTTNKTMYTSTNRSFNKKYTYKIRSYYKTSSGKYYYSYYTDTKSITTSKLSSYKRDLNYIYYQYNYSKTKQKKYCNASIYSNGCGPTAMAITASNLLNKKITPPYLGEYGCQLGDFDNDGSDHDFFDKVIARKYGDKLTGRWVTKSNSDEALKALSEGKSIIIAHMKKGHFTKGGHYITLVGVRDNGKQVLVQDPSSSKRSKWWDFSIVKNEGKTSSYSTPFLIVTKK